MRYKTHKKGLVLVGVLWVVVVMTAIVAIVSQTSRLDMKMSTGAMDEVRCKWACRAGTETALAILNEDTRDSDCLSDLWSDNDEDLTDVRLERCIYSVLVTDEAGKLNVNVASKVQLMALPNMTEQIADAIIDWRDRDNTPASEGAEATYYRDLAYPYTIRNANFKTIRELLAVKGVTEALLYGEDTNLNGQLDYNEMDGDISPPADNGDHYLDEGWIAYLTCYSYDSDVDADGEARVNINQANEQQLTESLGLNAAQARWIVQNRGGRFQTIADIVSQNDSSSSEMSVETSTGNDQTQPIDLQTFRSIADNITVSDESEIPGRVNINTASAEVLTALLGGEVSRSVAQAIVAERAGLLYGFTSIADLLDVESLDLNRFKVIAPLVTVRSNVYTVRCFATAAISGASVQTECVVDRSEPPCSVLYWYQGANY